ncbi:GNAT family N-acetyltransferase [Roseivirga sp. E12]|uniref:GNAT family N-acetyltransferase n=1 Tax=Roseivirga sp. E12 TaxID=2819237 RepID=UPI001ABCF1FD|nr:GNAT family N-acetyltransferase [Roseivirga sp. E12]MBO3698116.1 GNAT family N-acetyltransferase [Roseivirga sp. E12]
MSNYRLYDVLSSKTKVSYISYAYNDPAFLNTNNDFDKVHFYWIDDQADEAHAHVAFSIVDDIAYSPHKLPFGGLEVSEALSEEDITAFLLNVEQALVTMKINRVRIHQAPDTYFSQSKIASALIDCEYQSIQERVFHTIAVDESDLLDRMHKMEQRKNKKCVDGGATFKEVKRDKKKVFQWINRFRELDYKPPSMSWADLENTNSLNPKMYRVFGVYMDDFMLAATVVVVVNDEAVYHFMPASDVEFRHYRKYSPMVFLVNNLYKWCQDNSIRVLDLGTSYVDMKMKESLANFKEHLGGKTSEAVSWEKKLNHKTVSN